MATYKPNTVQPRPTAGIKIAKPGFNVETATDYELSFSTSWPSLAVAFTQTINLTPGGGGNVGQFDHPLKFPPFTMVWVVQGGVCTRRTFPSVTDKTIFINDPIATAPGIYYTECYNLDISKQISYNFVPPPPLAIGGKYDNNYGVKFAKPGKSINSRDLNDFIFHSRAQSPALFVVNTTFDVGAKTITFHRKKNLQYYDISAKSNYNFEKPFLWLARKLVGNPALVCSIPLRGLEKPGVLTVRKDFVAAPALAPPTAQVDEALLERYRQEMEDASAIPLPGEDDDDDL